jgi:16S rRNA (guanine527-N7)-methyltransferase
VSAEEQTPNDSLAFEAWASLLTRGAAALGVPLGDQVLQRVWEYTARLRERSRTVNLIGTTDLEAITRLHLIDSLALLRFLPPDARLCADIGTGAGLPGMVAALADADIRWTLIDSSRKRCRFLEEVQSGLEIPNVIVHCARAEEAGREPTMRQAYDAVVCRAVGALGLVAEYCLPLVRVGGRFLAMKGPAVDGEAAEALPVIESLGGRLDGVVAYRLPNGGEERRAAIVDKVAATPERFPRRPGLAAKRARRVDRRGSDV